MVNISRRPGETKDHLIAICFSKGLLWIILVPVACAIVYWTHDPVIVGGGAGQATAPKPNLRTTTTTTPQAVDHTVNDVAAQKQEEARQQEEKDKLELEALARADAAAEEAKKKADEEAAAAKAAEEEAEERKKAEEEAAKKKAEEEEAAAKKKAEEEEAAAKKKAEEEEAAAKQTAEQETTDTKPKDDGSTETSGGDDSYLDETYDICCVGAGLSGSIIAERYANLLGKKILIVEKRDHIAGNCYDYVDNETDILVNKYGAHLFHTNYERVWNYIQLFSNWTWYEHRVLGLINGKHVPVPVGIDTVNNLFGLNISTPEEMRYWLKKETSVSALEPAFSVPRNSEEMAMSRVGKRLYELIFHPYTIKQWAKEPSNLGPEVTARIPVRDNYDDRYFADKYQALPSRGYTKLFEKFLDHENITYKLNVDYFNIKDKMKCKDRIYFTGPIDDFYAQQKWEKLEYRSLDFERGVRMNTKFFQPLSVVNHPAAEDNYTRIVEYKHYLNQSHKPHTVFFYEHSKDGGDPYYPVPNKKNKELFEKYKKLADESKNVSFVGRLANYKYFNMDQSILNALELFDKDTGLKEEDHKVPIATYPLPDPHDFTKPYETTPGDGFPTLQDVGRVVMAPDEDWVTSDDEKIRATGDPWVQLAKAFRTFLPEDSVHFMLPQAQTDAAATERKLVTLHSSFKEEYKVESIPVVSKEDNLARGDVLVLPEDAPCPTALVEKNVTVVHWLLHQNKTNNSTLLEAQKGGCKIASANFAIAAHANSVLGKDGPIIYAESILRPYLPPTLVKKQDDAAMQEKKDNNVVVADTSDESELLPTLEEECKAESLGCTASRVTTAEEARGVGQSATAVVVKGCEPEVMVAAPSFRLALEMTLQGSILVVVLCEEADGEDWRDLPIPQRNIIKNFKESAKPVLERIISNYTEEFKEYAEFRELYGMELNETTLAWEAKSFHHAIRSSSQYIL